MPRTSRPWAIPDQVGWCAISAVNWVIASTKTRSKKSSSGVTRSPSRSVVPRREERVSSAAAMRRIFAISPSRPSVPVRFMHCQGAKGAPEARSGCVFGVVALEQPLLLVALGEGEEDERAADQDRDDAGGVGPGVSLQEGGLGGGDDLLAVCRVLAGEVGGAGEGLGQLAFDVFGDPGRFARGGDRFAGGGGVAGGEQGAEDRLHDRADEVALQVGRARG